MVYYFIIIWVFMISRYGMNCDIPQFYNIDIFDDCFQGAKGWYPLNSQCLFPLTQFERNASVAIQMCGSVNHSSGYRETNWLIAKKLQRIFAQSTVLQKLYWTGLRIIDTHTMGVDSQDALIGSEAVLANFTSIYNPLWAKGQPPKEMPDYTMLQSCVALDLRNDEMFGWRVLPCETQLPVLCQNYACKSGYFRCEDNSRCIPPDFLHDGFDDCLDGSDEKTVETIQSNSLDVNQHPLFISPVSFSSNGTLSPTTIRYGRGGCTHRWTIISPNNRSFAISIEWLNPLSNARFKIEGIRKDDILQLDSRNSSSSTSRILTSFSSFIITAENADTRRTDFLVHYSEIDESTCKVTSDDKITFNSKSDPTNCDFHYSSEVVTDYSALLIKQCSSSMPFVANILYNNSTFVLQPSQSQKLLIIPSFQFSIHVNSTWPNPTKNLDIQVFRLSAFDQENRKLDIFITERRFDVQWLSSEKSETMTALRRDLSINMIITDEDPGAASMMNATWNVEKFGRDVFSTTMSNGCVQLVSSNNSRLISSPCSLSSFGPTTLFFNQITCSFEFHGHYSLSTPSPSSPPDFNLNVIDVEATTEISTTTSGPLNRCKLPIVINGYITNVDFSSSYSYGLGTKVYIECSVGYTAIEAYRTLTCTFSEQWDTLDPNLTIQNNTVVCSSIFCSSITPVEQNYGFIPKNGGSSGYGAVRSYDNWPYLGFSPFCVCGENKPNPDLWSCYNSGDDPMNTFAQACISPQVKNGMFQPSANQKTHVYANGSEASLTCYFCSTSNHLYTCIDGIWKDQSGNFSAYQEIDCDQICANGTQLLQDSQNSNPCGAHGTVVAFPGNITSCDCDPGYKYISGICLDIDECQEGISLCDPFASCTNTIGSYRCSCPVGWQLLYPNNTIFYQTFNNDLLIGISCVETLCDLEVVKNSFYNSDFDLIYPPYRQYYRHTEMSGDIFATNMCGGASNEPCVVPFTYLCLETNFIPMNDIRKQCPLNRNGLIITEKTSFGDYVFGISTASCYDKGKILIGRPDIFCNWYDGWDTLPICVKESCSNLSQFVDRPLYIASQLDPWLVNSTVVFGCDDGYILSGYQSMTCLNSTGGPQWNPPYIPTCVPLTPTPSTPSSSTTHNPGFAMDEGIVVENTAIFEETDILHLPYKWTRTSDWEWTSSGCLVHSYSHPISFLLTSTSVFLDSDEIELVVDLKQCLSTVQIAIHSSDDGFIPPISEFLPVMTTTSSGSAVVSIRNLQSFLSMSISASGYVIICGVKIRQRKCKEVDFGQLHLRADKPMKFNRMIGATCNNRPTQVSGRCDARKGWVIQNTNCCTPPRPCTTPLRDETQQTTCGINSCANGVCHQLDNTFYCVCNTDFINEISNNQTCVPNHCAYTNQDKTSRYDCRTGKNDPTIECREAGLSGEFCQFQGVVSNPSIETFIVNTTLNSNTAISTNICNSPDTNYAIPNSQCLPSPQTTVSPFSRCGFCEHKESCSLDFPYVGTDSCSCEIGYYGRHCDVSGFCLSTQGKYNCENGGTCMPQAQKCICSDGWAGTFCQQPVDSSNCTAEHIKDCVHGECRLNHYKEPYCNCGEGFIKDQNGSCTIPYDGCFLNNPCQQAGICHWAPDNGTFSCDCSKTGGWTGSYCEVPPEASSCVSCNSGHSLNCITSFPGVSRCECAVGYKGENCDSRIDSCAFIPCFNNGECEVYDYVDKSLLVEAYNCSCPIGFSGSNCEIVSDQKCEDLIQCENGGTCRFDENGNAVCVCSSQQFYGSRCEKSCSDICAHADGCETRNGSVWCNCYPGYSSQHCDVMDDVCKGNMLTCRNGGTCDPQNQTCHCDVARYSGKYCEVDKNQCVVNSIKCQNGGICDPSSGICECPPSFNGDHCENEIDFCMNTMCYNGGTCMTNNMTCTCPPGTTGDHCQSFGQPCMVQLPDGSMTDYCMNGGTCFELPEGAACDCGGTDYTGRRCEIRITFNFNLVFNGMQYNPQIVSNAFSNSSAREFSVCSFIQYNYNTDSSTVPNLPPYLAMRSYTGSNQQIVFDNLGFHMCDDQKTCVTGKSDNNFRRISITPNTWHHFCLISPAANEVTPTYTAYLDGVKVVEQYADRFDPAFYGYLILAPADLAPRDHLFQGMISMTQMYVVRLNDSQIGRLAFDCFDTILKDVDMQRSAILKWDSNFTRVSAVNPGVSVDPAGICSSVKCMFGRQVRGNNYNSTGSCEKDRLPPTVFRCPNSLYRVTSEDYAKVEWDDKDVAFFDNIGVVRIETNFHNGQQFGIGISTIRYVAFDAAGNSAECSFDVAVTKKICPALDQIVVPNGKIEFIPNAGTFSPVAAVVRCDDPNFPYETHPKFYACDIMGSYKDGSWAEAEKNQYYYLPACGKTTNAKQLVNGTVVGSGTCSQMSLKLRDTLWGSINCDALECKLRILPPCGDSSSFMESTGTSGNTALQYEFMTGSALTTISEQVSTALQSNFNFVTQESTVSCNLTYPIHVTNQNSTFCVSCPEGSYADIAANECTLCPRDTFRNNTQSQLSCEKCPEGETTGDYEGAVDASQCYVICPIGQYADPSTDKCEPCGVGTYGSAEGLLNCTSCGFDLSTENEGSTSPSDCSVTCPAGQQMVRKDDVPVPVCINCVKGYYKESTRGPCVQCPRGLTTKLESGANSVNQCDSLNCIDSNTMKNPNVTAGPNVPYSELCLTCAQGSFQNTSNADHCYSCTELTNDDANEIPVTCQSTCSPDAPTDGCNCQFQTLSGKNSSILFRNCLPEVKDAPSHGNAIAIALPVVFGVLILIVSCVAFFFRKQIIAWFRKTEQSDNQNVAPGFWSAPNHSENSRPDIEVNSTGSQRSIIQRSIVQIPRPNLRIVTNRAELDQLPPLPSSSTPSLHADSNPSVFGSRLIQNLTTASTNRATVGFEANGSPKYGRQRNSSGSSLDSFF